MRYFKSLILMATVLFAAACDKKEPVEVPKEPEAPVVVSATLRGAAGETEILAGKPVVFRAEVTVNNSELNGFTLEVKKDGAIIGSASGELSGTSAIIDTELDLAISLATLEAPFFPAVTLKVTNTDEMYVEKTLTEAENVKITTMELMDALWLVDDLGFAYQMSPTSQKGKYRTTADLEAIGASFQIVSKVTEDGAIDPSGENYGTFQTPDYGEYGLYWIGYDVFTGELSKCLNYTCVMDYTKMASDGDAKVYWSYSIVQDCRVVFLNFPEGLKLQADRWADVDGNTARYTGHTCEKFEIYFVPQVDWLIIKEQYSNPVSMWVTGENASLPMTPYAGEYSFCWFGGDANWKYSWDRATAVMKSESDWEILLYLKANFALKLYYREASWGSECDWTSTTPETLVISPMEENPETGAVDGNYGNAGPAFTEGLWTLKYNTSTEEVSLEPYLGPVLGGVATGDKDPDAPEQPEPEIPDVPEPETSALYLVDNNGNAWAMSLLKDTHFVTDEATGNIGTSFRFAEKYADGQIDETGYVSEEFALDAAYAVHGKKPWKVGFDKAAGKVIYREGIWKTGLGDLGNGTFVQWVQCMPQDCEIYFFGFDKPVADLVNCAVFKDIDEVNCCARYIGVSDNYELRYRPEQGWLAFGNWISSATNKYTLIGKNASFPQSPYTEFPIVESDISHSSNVFKSNIMYQVSENEYRSQIYLADNYAFHIYGGYAWGEYKKDWTSLSPEVLVAKADGGLYYGVQNVEKTFTPGVYELVYDKSANTVSLTLIKADGQAPAPDPEPETPPTALTLTDNNGTAWNMVVFNGSHFITEGETGNIGTSFTVKGDNGKDYGEFQLDAAYAVHGKKPWKVGFDKAAGKVIYREGIWKTGLGDLGNGTFVQWVQCMPQDCEIYFFGFDKPVADLVNCAVFKDIDEVNCCARYIGVSDNYELRYRPEQGWLAFGNWISSATNKYTLIGKNASFPQSPYTEFPIVESDISHSSNVFKSNIMYQVSENEYRSQIYLADNYAFHIYGGYAWGEYKKDWTSLSPEVLVAKADGGLYYGVQNVEKTFTPGVYELVYNKADNTVSLTKVDE